MNLTGWEDINHCAQYDFPICIRVQGNQDDQASCNVNKMQIFLFLEVLISEAQDHLST